MNAKRKVRTRNRRRGVTAAFVAISMVVLMMMAALTIDVGTMYRARNEAQASADAAAMAAAWRLMDQNRLKGSAYVTSVMDASRTTAVNIAGQNRILNVPPTLDLNSGNDASGDIVIGRLNKPGDPNESLGFGNAATYNAVHVLMRRDEVRNGPIDLLFAWIAGHRTTDISAAGTAAFYDGVIGWRVTSQTGNAGLLPFALRKSAWDGLMAGTLTTGDLYSHNPTSHAVTAGPDGILELNLYPGGGLGQLPPGNFGTVDIGAPGNSTADLARQILHGVNESDLAYFGGELKLGPDGTLLLNGDTGLSAGIKDELAAIKGLPRALPIFESVSGNGNNSTFVIVGFVGITILDVKLTGSMSSKKVIIQPAYVLDDSAIVGDQSGQSSFVYRPVQLVR